MHEAVRTDQAPGAIGPYCQAAKAGGWLWCSGQIPLDPATGEMVGGSIADQTRRVLDNLTAVVEAGGGTMRDVVRCTVYLADMDDFAAVNEVYATYFGDPPPARAAVQAARLPKDARVEIDAVAWLDGGGAGSR